MSDTVDQASKVEEMFTQRGIEMARQASKVRLPFTGACHDCGAAVEEPRRFCDEECAEEYEYVQKRKRANGFA